MATAGILSRTDLTPQAAETSVRSRPASATTTASGASLAAWLVFASACITIGIIWDISWHVTIGRDTFWTPAHLLIHLGGSLGGFLCGWLCLDATFFRRRLWADQVIQVWGFRAPLGAWLCIWGAGAMLTSAPFDNWWHDTYGLDVKILSPPHMVLAMGMYGVVTGALFLASSARNRAAELGQPSIAGTLALLAQGIQLAFASILLSEIASPNLQHSGRFAVGTAIIFPALLTAAAITHPFRWGATRVASVYMLVIAGMIWILPLFPAEPKLAPIHNRVDHMVPSAFPLLLVIPAFGLDLALGRLRRRRGWIPTAQLILTASTVFLALFLVTQWYFSEFMISPKADNAFFAGHGRFFGYGNTRGEGQERFWHNREVRELDAGAVGLAWLAAVASSTVGCNMGRFASRLRR